MHKVGGACRGRAGRSCSAHSAPLRLSPPPSTSCPSHFMADYIQWNTIGQGWVQSDTIRRGLMHPTCLDALKRGRTRPDAPGRAQTHAGVVGCDLIRLGVVRRSLCGRAGMVGWGCPPVLVRFQQRSHERRHGCLRRGIPLRAAPCASFPVFDPCADSYRAATRTTTQ